MLAVVKQMAFYEYEKLHSPNTIRLIRLVLGNRNEPLMGVL